MAFFDLNLRGQTVLVTGATSGIGAACARFFGEAGCNVVVNCLHKCASSAEAVVRQIETSGGKAIAIPADVTSESDVETMFAEAREHFGTVHVLINNAGIEIGSPFAQMSFEDWRKVVAVDLDGQFLCAREAVREFLRRGMQPEVSRARGKIICMSSAHDTIPWAFQTNYAASKGGVLMLMKSLAQEYALQKIRVNAISPGAIRTPINTDIWETRNALEKLMKLIPYDRIGEPEDVARTALFLASDVSDYITGTSIHCDGGMTLYPGFRGAG